jgi:hypothetical protein
MSKRSEHEGKLEGEFSGLYAVFHAVACAFDKDDFGVVKEAVEDGGGMVLSPLKIAGHCLKALLVVSTMEPRSRWLMTWKRRSAPR